MKRRTRPIPAYKARRLERERNRGWGPWQTFTVGYSNPYLRKLTAAPAMSNPYLRGKCAA